MLHSLYISQQFNCLTLASPAEGFPAHSVVSAVSQCELAPAHLRVYERWAELVREGRTFEKLTLAEHNRQHIAHAHKDFVFSSIEHITLEEAEFANASWHTTVLSTHSPSAWLQAYEYVYVISWGLRKCVLNIVIESTSRESFT